MIELTDEELRFADPAAWAKKHKNDVPEEEMFIPLTDLPQGRYKCRFPSGARIGFHPYSRRTDDYDKFGSNLGTGKDDHVFYVKNLSVSPVSGVSFYGGCVYHVRAVSFIDLKQVRSLYKSPAGAWLLRDGDLVGSHRYDTQWTYDFYTDIRGLRQLAFVYTQSPYLYRDHFCNFCKAVIGRYGR